MYLTSLFCLSPNYSSEDILDAHDYKAMTADPGEAGLSVYRDEEVSSLAANSNR